MENKKNTILLTVIAVATLLVAVVGATFAYFTATGSDSKEGNVTVTTGTAASSEFGTISAINIYADASTFNQTAAKAEDGLRAHTGTSEGTVSWTAPGAAGNKTPSEADRTFCYTATLNITANTFERTTALNGKAELEFTAVKGDVTLIDKMDITTTKTNVQIPTGADSSEYTHKIIADAGVQKTDSWKLTVTLLNYDENQNVNAGKQFTGAIAFKKVNC